MLFVKLFVLFVCINVLCAIQTDYCDICSNHTLCLYNSSGPSSTCNFYNSSSLLSEYDIRELVHRINERRNFIALGQSKLLPQAANMKKIRWSMTLATFAQRWADQCDPSLNPDKEDNCRDLESAKVGQTIASVIGPSPGLNIKSFIDVWFMQMLEYSGTVSFYNQSRDYITKYLTQLIWAETELVGCGKVKFYIEKKQVERLICNFAPKGNIHGKPVYAIGSPGTQCIDKMVADDLYKGLCNYEDIKIRTVRKLKNSIPSEESLLKILNLPNDSVRHEIDSLQNNNKQSNLKRLRQRDQKTRHILPANHGTLKRTSMRKQHFRKDFIHNMSKNMNNEANHQYEQGHSNLHHVHDVPHIQEPPRIIDPANYYFQRNNNHNSEKYHSVTPVYFTSSSNYRIPLQKCTRKTQFNINKYCNGHQCTRQDNGCHQTITCQSRTFANPIMPYHFCPCTIESIARCPFYCPDLFTVTENCPMKDITYTDIPNMVRSGNRKTVEEITVPKEYSKQFHELKSSKINKIVHVLTENYELPEDIDDESEQSKDSIQDRDYLYRAFNPSLRSKRKHMDDITLKPFWKLDELSYKGTPDMTLIRYTTLPNVKIRKTGRNLQPAKMLFDSSEAITIKPETHYTKKQIYEELDDEIQTTEKYLSFDELMYLKKFSDNFMDYNRRRQGGRKNDQNSNGKTVQATTTKQTNTVKQITTKGSSTPIKIVRSDFSLENEYTANTLFERRKHCTRKLTCTWTAFTGMADENRIKEFGSRTPPGYVEGCTRTSTCTRDFMDRNKMATSTTVTDLENHESTSEDEEYCERRSLKIDKRNSDQLINQSKDLKPLPRVERDDNALPIDITNVSKNYSTDYDSITEKNIKLNRQKRMPSKLLTYGDLYYLILNKLIKENQDGDHKKCPCNSATDVNKFPILFLLFCHLTYIKAQHVFNQIN